MRLISERVAQSNFKSYYNNFDNGLFSVCEYGSIPSLSNVLIPTAYESLKSRPFDRPLKSEASKIIIRDAKKLMIYKNNCTWPVQVPLFIY